MILKNPPQVFYTGGVLTEAIGAPEDFVKNKDSGNFPDINLRIPAVNDTTDITGKFEKNLRVSNRKSDHFEERKGMNHEASRGQYQATSKLEQVQNSSSVDSGDTYMPIKALNQFNTDWCIKARILKKYDMRSYRNAKGEGVILTLDIIDREGTMIQATAFNETAKKLEQQVEQNKIYTFAGGQVKIANKKFTSIKNDYCLTLGYETVVEKAEEDLKIQENGFSFTSINEIENFIQAVNIDVIGVILDVQPVSQIQTRDGTSRDRRSLVLGDESNVSIGLTLWG